MTIVIAPPEAATDVLCRRPSQGRRLEKIQLPALTGRVTGMLLTGVDTDSSQGRPEGSDRVVLPGIRKAPADYDSVAEILTTNTPALVVPRDRPRLEQLIRARPLRAQEAVDVLSAGALAGVAIGAWPSGREAPGERLPRPVRGPCRASLRRRW